MTWIRTPEAVAVGAPRPSSGPSPLSLLAGMTSLSRALALHPTGAEAWLGHGRALLEDPSPLSRAQAHLIALVVSATDGCAYCVAHEGPALASALGDEFLARAVAKDYREANLAARDRVLLDYAVALTCEPSERKQEDVERVREYGFTDDAILRATHLAAYVGLIDRLASGLGVGLEPGVDVWEFGTQR